MLDDAVPPSEQEPTRKDDTASQSTVKTKLRKKRGDAARCARKRETSVKLQKQSIRRRLARARWALLMLLPPLLLLLHRTERVESETHGLLTTAWTIGVFLCLGCVSAANEVFGTSHVPTYVVAVAFSFLWGGVIVAIRDLAAARLCCMVWFGVCSGNLRYHWADYEAVGSPTGSTSVSKPDGAKRDRGDQNALGYSSGSTTMPTWSDTSNTRPGDSGPSPLGTEAEAHPDVPCITDTPMPSRWNDFGARSLDFLQGTVWRKVGLCLCATVGEVVGCAVCVPNSWSEIIAVSWLGYAAVLIFPIVVYKCASWVSHLLILVCGSRVNTADASRLLFLYWVTTTVLSLGALVLTMVWILTSLVPYVWALQVLMTPYSVVFELVAFESKEYQATNPYKEVAEVYREHIDATMQNSKEYFLH